MACGGGAPATPAHASHSACCSWATWKRRRWVRCVCVVEWLSRAGQQAGGHTGNCSFFGVGCLFVVQSQQRRSIWWQAVLQCLCVWAGCDIAAAAAAASDHVCQPVHRCGPQHNQGGCRQGCVCVLGDLHAAHNTQTTHIPAPLSGCRINQPWPLYCFSRPHPLAHDRV